MQSLTPTLDVDEVIYFFEQPGAGIYIGTTGEWSRRRDHHMAAGRTFLAFMRGGLAFERRIHTYFDPVRVDVPRCQSVFQAEPVMRYLLWLLEAGLATDTEGDLPHLPPTLWEAIDPAIPRQPVFTALPPSKQLSLIEDNPAPEPETLLVRVRRSTTFACYSSESDEWYTPAEVVESARLVMGRIDLDPASCPVANRTVRASAYYSQRQDGLHPSRPWRGCVWMNPPYGGKAKDFTNRLLVELAAGNVEQAIVLLGSQAMVTQWADPAIRAAASIGFTRGRWAFEPGNGQATSSPAGGSALLYYGPNREAFARVYDSELHCLFPAWPPPP